MIWLAAYSKSCKVADMYCISKYPGLVHVDDSGLRTSPYKKKKKKRNNSSTKLFFHEVEFKWHLLGCYNMIKRHVKTNETSEELVQKILKSFCLQMFILYCFCLFVWFVQDIHSINLENKWNKSSGQGRPLFSFH